MDPNLTLVKTDDNLLADSTSYRRLLERMLYLTTSPPELSFTVNNISQFMRKPTVIYLDAANKVLYYVKNIVGQGIFFFVNFTLYLKGFSDLD